MTGKRLVLLVSLVVSPLVLGGLARAGAGQIVSPSADEVRFQLIGNEPIAGPDNYSLVRGWSALVFKDRDGGRCYVALTRGDAIALEAMPSCPE